MARRPPCGAPGPQDPIGASCPSTPRCSALTRTRRLVLALVLAATCVAPASAAAQADRYTPLVMSTMSTPHWFTGSDGRVHLVYELSLTNGFPVPVTVTAVSARAGNRGGRTIERLGGAELEASIT